MIIQQEGLLAMELDEELIAVVRADRNRRQVFYKCEAMGMDEIEHFLKGREGKIKGITL
jgi:hypothetical protein